MTGGIFLFGNVFIEICQLSPNTVYGQYVTIWFISLRPFTTYCISGLYIRVCVCVLFVMFIIS